MTRGDQYPGQQPGPGFGRVPPQGQPQPGTYGTPRHEPQQGGYGQPADPHGPPRYGPPQDPPARHPQPEFGPPPGQPGFGAPPQPPPPGMPNFGPPPGVPEPPAAPGFGSSQFAEPPGFGPPPAPPKTGSRFWLTILAVLGALVLIAGCGVGAYYTFQNDGTPTASSSSKPPASEDTSPSKSPSPTSSPIDISSRSTDPEPLTVNELFGDKKLSIEDDSTGKARTYKVVKTQELKDCAKAVTGDLENLVRKLGCNQVVRAAINTADGKFGATAGALNLKEKGSGDKINPLVKDSESNSFSGLEGPGASAKINKASGALYWQEDGHYMVYVVICRGDGKQISLDKKVQAIATDLLIRHLTTRLAERTGTVN